MCQRHASVVTSVKLWTTIPPSFQKTDDEIRRLCDIHLLYVCKDTYSVLKPVFEWKREVPIGEVSLLTSTEPLSDTTDTVLAKESSEQNVVEIKQETEPAPTEVQDQLGLVDIPPLPDTDRSLPDATVNLLVDLPGVSVSETPMDATSTVPTIDDEGKPTDATTKVNDGNDEFNTPSQTMLPVQNPATSVPCSSILKDVSVKLKGKTSVRFPPTEEEMCKAKVCLQRIDHASDDLPRLRGWKRQRSQGNQPTRKAKDRVKYVFMDATSGEDTKPNVMASTSDKSSPSGYRLAAHQYMVAKKQGLIEGPRTRTRALKITKPSQVTSTDSEATVDYMSDNAPPPRKCRHQQRTISQGKLVTKSFVLRKDGKGMQPSKKPKLRQRKKHSLKCIKCNKHCKSVHALNQHFKEQHRPLQCNKCNKFFQTQGALKLHSYKHVDGQFECSDCKKTFPSKVNWNSISQVMRWTDHTDVWKRDVSTASLTNI